MSHSPLTKSGYPNLSTGKKVRAPRLIDNKDGTFSYNLLDMMKWWSFKEEGEWARDEKGEIIVKRANTTGCKGSKTIAGKGGGCIIIAKNAPGKYKRKYKPKKKVSKDNLCHRCPKNPEIEASKHYLVKLAQKRGRLHSKIIAGSANGAEKIRFQEFTLELKSVVSPDVWAGIVKKDIQREKSIKGIMAKIAQ